MNILKNIYHKIKNIYKEINIYNIFKYTSNKKIY